MTMIPEMSLEELKGKLERDLHVLVVAVSGAWGGLEQTALADARELARHGLKVTLLVKEASTLHNQALQFSSDLQIETYPYQVRKFIDPAFVRATRQVIQRRNINLVHCHQGSLMASLVPALVALSGVSLVLSRHILNSHNKKNLFHALLYRRVDYVLVLSETMRRNLISTFPIAEKKLRIVNLGLDLGSFDPEKVSRESMRTKWGIPERKFLVGVVGRLDPMKRRDLLIKALAGIRSQIPEVHGVLVGAETPGLNGSYIKSLEQTVKDLHMEDAISIVGPETNIPEVMAALDLLVMPSEAEAFGLVALEAMVMGIPTILSRAGSGEELAEEGRSILIRPGDAYDLSRKIKNLIADETARKRMAERAKKFVVARYTAEGRLHKTLEVYLRCMRRRSGS